MLISVPTVTRSLRLDRKGYMNFIGQITKKYQIKARQSEKLGKFSIYGNPTEIETAKKLLESNLIEKELNGQETEEKIRIKVQKLIDENKIAADILYDGNTVYGFDRIMQDFNRILKGGVEKLTDRLYKFFSLNFTIAHYDKNGWIQTYPTLTDVLDVLKKEKSWKADTRKIQEAMIEKLKQAAPKEKTNIVKFRK